MIKHRAQWSSRSIFSRALYQGVAPGSVSNHTLPHSAGFLNVTVVCCLDTLWSALPRGLERAHDFFFLFIEEASEPFSSSHTKVKFKGKFHSDLVYINPIKSSKVEFY